MSFTEAAMVTYGSRIVTTSKGLPGQVEFNFKSVWQYRRYVGRCFDPAHLHFIHVHPEGFSRYSALDVDCLRGLNTAFGYPVLFSIMLFKGPDLNDLGFELSSFRLIEGRMVEANNVGMISYPRYPAILKALAYLEDVPDDFD